MHNILLYKEIKDIPINKIQECVSNATKIPVSVMLQKTRKREIVSARQISMSLSKRFNSYSLEKIGEKHGGKDHATVLHACKTIQNLLDTKDLAITRDYNDSLHYIKEWCNKQADLIKPTLSDLKRKEKLLVKELYEVRNYIHKFEYKPIDSSMIKTWIRNRVPLNTRELLLNLYKQSKI